jgi:hypothetical protein
MPASLKDRNAKASSWVGRAARPYPGQSRYFNRFNRHQSKKQALFRYFLTCSPIDSGESSYQNHTILKRYCSSHFECCMQDLAPLTIENGHCETSK